MTDWASGHLSYFVLIIIGCMFLSKYIWFGIQLALDDIADYCLRYGAFSLWFLVALRNLLVLAILAAIILLFLVSWPLALIVGMVYAYLVIKKFFPFFGIS